MSEYFDELTRGLRLLSPKILDNIGIHINVSTLPSAELYWLIREEWFGHWFLGRFYARYLRAIIEPDKHKRIRALWEQMQDTRRQEMITAVFEKGRESIDER